MKQLPILGLLIALLVALCTRTEAQVFTPPPFISIAEGPIKGIAKRPDGTLLMTVMGTPVIANATTRLYTSQAVLTMDQVLSTQRFPGRLQRGLMNGTAIAQGYTDDNGILTATHINLSPAENVIVGRLTQNSGGILAINRMNIKYCDDARMPARPPMNPFAIAIDIAGIPVGTSATGEGYYDDEGSFRATSVFIDTLVAPPLTTDPQVSFIVVRAVEQIPNVQKGDTLDVRGGVTFFHEPASLTQTIQIFRVDMVNGRRVETYLGGTIATRNVGSPSYGLWNFKTTTAPSASPIYGSAPVTIKAVNISPGANNAFIEDLCDVR
jgi:hypothetical protein